METSERLLPKTVAKFAMCLILSLSAASAVQAQGAKKAPAKPEMPRSATALCTDNTWSSAATQQGACSKHGGVSKWFGKAPKGATARCKDGEYWTSPEHHGACTGHDGVAFLLGKKSK